MDHPLGLRCEPANKEGVFMRCAGVILQSRSLSTELGKSEVVFQEWT